VFGERLRQLKSLPENQPVVTVNPLKLSSEGRLDKLPPTLTSPVT
jgi:hypothetical protein